MSDVTNDYLALRRTVGARVGTRQAVAATGDDVVDFLQGQLSQDVAAIAVGASAMSLLLQPQGKVDAYLRLTRLAEQHFILDVDAGWVDPMVTRLNRFKLRTKVDFAPLDWASVSLRGPDAMAVDSSGAEVAAAVDWAGLPGVDLLGPGVAAPDGIAEVGAEAYDAVRIEAGVPVMGRELDADTIPEAAGIVADAVSFTKGCYTGQELVARIDSRGGNVPQRLRGLIFEANVLVPEGAEVIAGDEDKVVGRITSVAESLDLRAPVALAYVGRAVEPPAAVEVRWSGGVAPATVKALPLLTHDAT